MPTWTVCGYLTDVEGNFDYFERYLAISKVLQWDDEKTKTKLKFRRDDSIFVFGGDSQDKGIGDVRFVKLLLALKKEHPDRVQFIIGNRDANKMRLTSELSAECINDKAILTDKSFPYWVAEKSRMTPQMFLDKIGSNENNAANRLRWMLKETMGADGAFDRRREELSIIRGCKKDAVSDDDVVASYIEEVDPKAPIEKCWMLQYLAQGKLAFVFGSNLFVHGALSSANMGTVPGGSSREQDVHAWVRALNSWAQNEVHVFKTDPYSGKNGRGRKGGGLIDYGVPGGNAGATVIYDHNLENGNGRHMMKEVQEFLLKSNIVNVISGHQPHGDCPLILKTGECTAITADTSYSKMGNKSSWGDDNRGDAVSEVLLDLNGHAHVHGVLADGTAIAYTLRPGTAAAKTKSKPLEALDVVLDYDLFVGRQLRTGYWVKAKIPPLPGRSDSQYLLCLGEGFKLTTALRSCAEMSALTADDFMQDVVVVGAKPQTRSMGGLGWVVVVTAAAAVAVAWWAQSQKL